MTPLPRAFYNRNARLVAPRLLGQLLVFDSDEGEVGGVIVETEAYLHNDPACHAFRGMTPRNAPMFGPPGRAYIYFTYGNHFCFNVVCMREGVAQAVLIRALAPTHGLDWMRARRQRQAERDLCSGPGKLTRAMGLGREQNGLDLCGGSALTIYRVETIARRPIVTTTRIGLGNSPAKGWPLRFYVGDSEFISRR